jgi:hypothetical protein
MIIIIIILIVIVIVTVILCRILRFLPPGSTSSYMSCAEMDGWMDEGKGSWEHTHLTRADSRSFRLTGFFLALLLLVSPTTTVIFIIIAHIINRIC